MRKLIICSIFTSYLLCQLPTHFELDREIQVNPGFPSNSVVDIQTGNNNLIFCGTSGGLALIEADPVHGLNFSTFNTDIYQLPQGGNPGLAVNGDVIAVSGAVEELAAGEYHPAGSGIGFSYDGGQTWYFQPQYVADRDSPQYIPFTWGGQELWQLAVTTEINNVSYDLAIHGNYIYAASWAGGIRRFNYADGIHEWEAVALPRDNELELNCGEDIDDNYELNPNDPGNGGFHNHKGFAVHAVEDTIWVGTAAGINKGIVDPQTNCINWRHYNAQMDGFSGNWVIAFNHQYLQDGTGNDFMRVWAVTWSTGVGESYGLSYTDDGGETWNSEPFFENLNTKIYSISVAGNKVYAPSELGLYYSDSGVNWERYNRAAEENGQEILSGTVYSAVYLEDQEILIEGTPDGIAWTENQGLDWSIYRYWIEAVKSSNDENRFYAYPNPFYSNLANIANGDGHVRFVHYDNNKSTELHIFDFNMSLVKNFHKGDFHSAGTDDSDQLEVIWNGRNDWGDLVANGVYFCRLTQGGDYYWTKLLVIN